MAVRSLLEEVLFRFFTAQRELGIEIESKKAGEFIALIHNSHCEDPTIPLPSIAAFKVLLQLEYGI
jgi:hypothetical protein